MSDSSDVEYSPDWIPYGERKEWADVSPIAQDDGENPIVAISYSNKFREIYDYFRGILATQEKSLRALELTKDALSLNPANYTVWKYRRDILQELECDLYQELEYVENVIRENAKNYQVWHHRQVIVSLLNDPSKELQLTEIALERDNKNYHAWQHRQWAISTFNLYENELKFVDRLIAEDIRNNSAWNQRFFVLKRNGFTKDVIMRELHYTMKRIRVVKNNESAWNYLKGIIKQSEDGILDQDPDVVEFCEELYESGIRSPYLIAFMIDMYEEKCLQAENVDDRELISKKIFGLCHDMSTQHDVIRRKYWQYVAAQLQQKIEKKAKSEE